MLTRIFAVLGYRTPDEAMDFVMTGTVVAPAVALIGSDIGTALLVLFCCLVTVIVVGPWAHAKAELQAKEDSARNNDRGRPKDRD